VRHVRNDRLQLAWRAFVNLSRYELTARFKACAWVVVGVTLVVGPLSYAISPDLDDVVFALGAGLAMGLGIALRAGARGGSLLGIGVGFVAGLAAALIAGNTAGRGIGLLVPPVVALCIGFMEGIEPPRRRSNGEIVGSAMIIGLVIGLGMWFAVGWAALLAGAITGLLVGMISGMRPNLQDGNHRRIRRPPLVQLILATLSIALVTALARSEMSEWSAWPTVSALISVTVFLFVVPVMSFLTGLVTARWLRPRLIVYAELGEYLRIMWVPVGGFALGFVGLIIVFAGFYGALYRTSSNAFAIDGSVHMIDWLFYSLFTAIGQQYTGINPTSGWSRLLVSLENIFCLGWMVVVFAAVMAYLQPRLESVTLTRHSSGERHDG